VWSEKDRVNCRIPKIALFDVLDGKNKKDFDINYHQKRVEETCPKPNKLAQATL